MVTLLGLAAGCLPADDLPPASGSSVGHITSMSPSSSSDSASETGDTSDTSDTSDTGDTDDCDPLADPLLECGPNMRCDLDTLSCVDATGSGGVDEPCELDDDCSPALICRDARCRELCSPTLGGDEPCSDGRICTYADAPVPGLCLEPCDMLTPNCSVSSDACKRGLGAGPSPVAVCVDNPGAGIVGDACERDGECMFDHLCTAAELHVVACADDAPSCCAPICDQLELPCFGLELTCYAIGIASQPSVGYCGV